MKDLDLPFQLPLPWLRHVLQVHAVPCETFIPAIFWLKQKETRASFLSHLIVLGHNTWDPTDITAHYGNESQPSENYSLQVRENVLI
jgi:hypothetical protein